MKFTVINVVNGNTDGHEFHVHKCGCRDLSKPLYTKRNNPKFNVEAPSPEQACQDLVLDFQNQDQQYGARDFKIFACCH